MIPPRRRRTRWRVDSYKVDAHQPTIPFIQQCIYPDSEPQIRPQYVARAIGSATSPSRTNRIARFSYPITKGHPNQTPRDWDPSYLLDVVVAQGAAILKLLTGEDQTLLVGGDTLLVLDLGLDVVDGVARLNVEGNGLTREGLDETIIGILSATFPPSSFISYLSQPVLGRIGGFKGSIWVRSTRETYICTVDARKKEQISSSPHIKITTPLITLE